ncbi:MAG: hypothetical protein M3495_20590 [Pseudomonadota bacterium]|nr:hypothetical protein [Pseudomonadota bacterium]
MWHDPIVEEVRRIRDKHAKRFNYDLHAICEDFRKMQSESGHEVVSRQPRRPLFYVTQQGAPGDAR